MSKGSLHYCAHQPDVQSTLKRGHDIDSPRDARSNLSSHRRWLPAVAKFFNSLRASRETDLMDEVGLRRVWAWIGDSAHVAVKNDALLKSTDFMEAGARRAETTTRKSDAKSDAAGGGNRITTSRTAIKAPQRIAWSCVPVLGIYKR